jgi:hypothetical protein
VTGSTIHKMSCGIESFDPVGAGHAGVKEESANVVVECPESVFGLPILGGRCKDKRDGERFHEWKGKIEGRDCRIHVHCRFEGKLGGVGIAY